MNYTNAELQYILKQVQSKAKATPGHLGLSSATNQGAYIKTGAFPKAYSSELDRMEEGVTNRDICLEGKKFYESLEERLREKVEMDLAEKGIKVAE